MSATVILDLYGTLAEPDWPALLHGRAELARRFGIDAAAAQAAWERTHASRMIGAYGHLADDLAAVFTEASAGPPLRISSGVRAELAAAERENWNRGVRLYPDAAPALGLLRASGLRLAIVTNASAEAAGVIDTLGLRELVDDVFASCDAGLLKPGLLGVALRGLGIDASQATLVDDEPAQLDGAARLGIGTILVRRRGTDASGATTAVAHRSVSDLRDAVDLAVPAAPARRQ
jgi:putative hydrolase of the HAD superfamily